MGRHTNRLLSKICWQKPRTWVAIVFVLALSVFAIQHWMMTPQVNLHPQKKVEVRGVFPYDRGWDLRIKTSFHSTNPKCKRTGRAFGLFPTAEVAREVWADIPVTREEGNRFSFTYFKHPKIQYAA